ncbi:MAG TPA: tryptophan synthase subunit beta, partial [Nitrospinaceae bacterium]|nr:tryptophan synthase subunit beta [Nitrospinaceae bacterium]
MTSTSSGFYDNPDSLPNSKGRFGPYGGKFVPETLMAALDELEVAFDEAKQDGSFWKEFEDLLANYVGRPTALYYAKNLTEKLGGSQIYIKREDL